MLCLSWQPSGRCFLYQQTPERRPLLSLYFDSVGKSDVPGQIYFAKERFHDRSVVPLREIRSVARRCGSMAIIGAARLADALQRHGIDHTAEFQEYHDKFCPFVEQGQEKAVRFGMKTMSPSDDAEIAERNRKLSEGSIDL